MGSNIESIDVKSDEALVDECIQEFNNYRDYIAIIVTIREVTMQSKEFGKFGGPEVHIQTKASDDSVELTPDALIDLSKKSVICIEIKTGDGGERTAIAQEVKDALRYCNAKSWRTGEKTRLINTSDLFFICTKNYWSKIKILMDANHEELGDLLNNEGVSILTWEYHESRIRIRRRHGNCRHQEYESHLKSNYLVQTDNALLVEYSQFLFTPMEPPPVYTAVILLTVVLPPRVSLKLGIRDIHTYTKDYALKPTRRGDQDQIRLSWIKKAMEILEKCSYAEKDNSKFTLKTPKRATKESLTKRICAKIHRIKKKVKKPKFEPDEDQSLLPDFFS